MKPIKLPDTDITIEYDRASRTLTLHGASFAYVDDSRYPGAWMVNPDVRHDTQLGIYRPGENAYWDQH